MKTWVYGDIHGAGQEFQKLVTTNHQPGDNHICVGDLFDRGLDQIKVWETITKYNIKAIKGNHEKKALDYLTGKRTHLPPHYYSAYQQLTSIISRDEIIQYLESLPQIIKFDDKTLITHGGIVLEDPWKEDVSANIYGNLKEPIPMDDSTTKFWWDRYQGDILVIYGHVVTQHDQPRIRQNKSNQINSIGLDTSVVHGGPLTSYCIETKTFSQYQSGIDWYRETKERNKLTPPTWR